MPLLLLRDILGSTRTGVLIQLCWIHFFIVLPGWILQYCFYILNMFGFVFFFFFLIYCYIKSLFPVLFLLVEIICFYSFEIL